MQRTQRSTRRPRSGAVLLLVIAAVVIAGVSLSGLASQSVRRVHEAARAEAALQSRWASRSIERMMLQEAEGLFARRDERVEAGLPIIGPRHQIRLQLPLGEQLFDVVIADEDAKANLNLLYHAGDVDAVDRAMQTLVGSNVRPLLRVKPLTGRLPFVPPEPASDEDEPDIPVLVPAFTSWGDVLNLGPLQATTGSTRELVTLTGRVTLWGGGQLNIKRADDETILMVLQSVLPEGQARLLVERLRANSSVDIGLVIDKTVQSSEQRLQLRRLLGTVSSSASVWIESRSRRSGSLSCVIRAAETDRLTRTYRFRL